MAANGFLTGSNTNTLPTVSQNQEVESKLSNETVGDNVVASPDIKREKDNTDNKQEKEDISRWEVFILGVPKAKFPSEDEATRTAFVVGIGKQTSFTAIPVTNKTLDAVFTQIETHQKAYRSANSHPLLHIHLSLQGSSSLLSLEGLKRFRESGGRLVITAMEFSEYPADSDNRAKMLAYLMHADAVIFLTEEDRKNAMDTAVALGRKCVEVLSAGGRQAALGGKSENERSTALLRKLEAAFIIGECAQHTTTNSEVRFDEYSRIYRSVQQLDPEVRAASKWRSVYHENRSYRLFESVNAINIKTQSNINLKNLSERLKTGIGLLPEMQRFILEKTNGKMLTPEESRIFRTLMKKRWYLKHVTPNLSLIRAGGFRLLSLTQREKAGDNISNAHTPSGEGNRDNVFFTVGPGDDFETVRFLAGIKTEIVVDLEGIRQNKIALEGMWSSGHMYAFNQEQRGKPANLWGVRYQVNYRIEKNKGISQEKFIKECIFTYSDGRTHTQILGKKDDIFRHPHIEQAVILMTIEKIRLLGEAAWKSVMQADEQTWTDIVQYFFNAGVFEVHKPGQFLLDQPGVSIREEAHIINWGGGQQMKPLIERVLEGRGGEVLEKLTEGTLPINERCFFNGYELNLFGAAILMGHRELIVRLLNIGMNSQYEFSETFSLWISKDPESSISAYRDTVEIGAYGAVAIYSNPDLARKVVQDMLGKREELESREIDSKGRYEQACAVIELLEKGNVFKQQTDIRHPIPLLFRDFRKIIYFLKPTSQLVERLLKCVVEKAKELPLKEIVSLGSISLLEAVLKMGADANDFSNCPWDPEKINPLFKHKLWIGYTPLMIAVELGQIELIDCLLAHKADINALYSLHSPERVIGNCDHVTIESEHEGFSALMFAVKKGDIEIVERLLNGGADLSTRALNGETAFSLARRAKNSDVLGLLKSRIVVREAYGVHEAVQKEDWETCSRLLMERPGLEMTLDAEGMSIYDINTRVLQQSFVPLMRQIEGHRRLLLRKQIIIIMHGNKESYFLLPTESTALPLPFFVFPYLNYNSDLITDFLKTLGVKFSSPPCFDTIGSLVASVGEKQVGYGEEITVLTFSMKEENEKNSINVNAIQVLPCTALRAYCENPREGSLKFDYEKVKISEIAARLMYLVLTKSSERKALAEGFKDLNRQYQGNRIALHKLVKEVEEGNRDSIITLLDQTGYSLNLFIHMPTFGIEIINSDNTPWIQSKACLLVDRLTDMECLGHLLKNATKDVLRNIASEKIIQIGKLEIYERYLAAFEEDMNHHHMAREVMREYIKLAFKNSKFDIVRELIKKYPSIVDKNDIFSQATEFFAWPIIEELWLEPDAASAYYARVLTDIISKYFNNSLVGFSQEQCVTNIVKVVQLLESRSRINNSLDILRKAIDKGKWQLSVHLLQLKAHNKPTPTIPIEIKKYNVNFIKSMESCYKEKHPQLSRFRKLLIDGDERSITQLLKEGMDVNAGLLITDEILRMELTRKTQAGSTVVDIPLLLSPLQIALKLGHYDCVNLLIRHGGHVNELAFTVQDAQAAVRAGRRDMLALFMASQQDKSTAVWVDLFDALKIDDAATFEFLWNHFDDGRSMNERVNIERMTGVVRTLLEKLWKVRSDDTTVVLPVLQRVLQNINLVHGFMYLLMRRFEETFLCNFDHEQTVDSYKELQKNEAIMKGNAIKYSLLKASSKQRAHLYGNELRIFYLWGTQYEKEATREVLEIIASGGLYQDDKDFFWVDSIEKLNFSQIAWLIENSSRKGGSDSIYMSQFLEKIVAILIDKDPVSKYGIKGLSEVIQAVSESEFFKGLDQERMLAFFVLSRFQKKITSKSESSSSSTSTETVVSTAPIAETTSISTTDMSSTTAMESCSSSSTITIQFDSTRGQQEQDVVSGPGIVNRRNTSPSQSEPNSSTSSTTPIETSSTTLMTETTSAPTIDSSPTTRQGSPESLPVTTQFGLT